MAKLLTIPLFLIASIICNLSIAASNENDENKILSQVSEFTLREDIVSLVELSASSPIKASKLMQRVAVDISTFNYAEQYLILLVKAKIKQQEQQHEDVISLIEEAKLLRKHIVEKQLDLPLFSNANFVLANSYAAIKDFDNAYQNKNRWRTSHC